MLTEKLKFDSIVDINENVRFLEDPINLAMGDIRPSSSQDKDFRDFISKALEYPMTYKAVLGVDELRNEIAKYFNIRDGTKLTKDNVVVTVGGMQSLFSSFNISKRPGGEVMVPNPSWSAYKSPIETNDLKIRRVNFWKNGEFVVDTVINNINPNTVAIVANIPENPTGRICSSDSLRELADNLERKYSDLFLIVDEAYLDLCFKKKIDSCVRFLEGHDKMIVVNSFSKAYGMTGWRVGYGISTEENIQKTRGSIRGTTTCVAKICQLGALYALRNHEKYNSRLLKELENRRDVLDEKLSNIKSIKYETPEAGIYFWLNCQKIGKDCLEMTKELCLEKEILTVPGSFFGSEGKHHIRLSFGYEYIQKILKGGDGLATYFNSL